MKTAHADLTNVLMRLLMWELRERMGYSNKDIGKAIDLSHKTVENYPHGAMTIYTFFGLIKHYKPEEFMKRLAEECDGIFIRIPDVDGNVSKILQGMSEVSKEFADLVQSVSTAVCPGGDGGTDITKREAQQLARELDEMIGKAARMKQFVQEVIDGRV